VDQVAELLGEVVALAPDPALVELRLALVDPALGLLAQVGGRVADAVEEGRIGTRSCRCRDMSHRRTPALPPALR
jgi:hypothetical protein